ncbi:MAG TPA: N-acetyltransferase [Clostridiales bacterium]|nr:N-acetyltransferase [Clostridiales bacterium]
MGSTGEAALRRARPEDAGDFARLMVESSPRFFPALFGIDASAVMRELFRYRGHVLSHEHTLVVEVGGRVAGMALAYDFRHRTLRELRTGLLLVRCLPLRMVRLAALLVRAQCTLGRLQRDEYYLSNIAVHPDFRGRGLGTRLLREVESSALRAGCRRVVLDAESDNERAIRLYSRLGYSVVARLPVLRFAGRSFEFVRMAKEVVRGRA